MSTAQVVLTVDAVIYRGGPQGLEVLLIQRAKNPYQGYWSLPGGKVTQRLSTPSVEKSGRKQPYMLVSSVSLEPMVILTVIHEDAT